MSNDNIETQHNLPDHTPQYGHHEQQHHHAHELHIIVTTTGDDLDGYFNVHEPLHIVKERAVHLVGNAQGANFRLEYDGTVLTDEHRTIEHYAHEFDWQCKVHLELVPNPEVM